MRRKSRSEQVKAADIISALSSVTKEKSISMDLVLHSLKDALATGARRLLNRPANVEVKLDREKGTIEVFTRQIVVEEVEEPELQISLDDAQKIDDELEVGDELIEELDIDVFGRTAIQSAKQVIIQRVREAEREKVFNDFTARIGELITGTVQQIDKGNILVNLGRTEALLPYREQIRKERYRQGDNIRGCIIDVRNNVKGPQVIVSRTCPDFLARLFELEVPEIFDGTVKIVKVVRDPGHRSKIAVSTSDSRVDPVGACVGMRGNRVQAIVRELSNERIDIINWTDELSLLVRRVFAPADVKRVVEVSETKIVVIVAEDELAQAIGREGQNIRLASRMIDKEIDIYGDEEFSGFSEEEREAIFSGETSKGGDRDEEDTGDEEDVTTDDGAEQADETGDDAADETGDAVALDDDDDGDDTDEDEAVSKIVEDAIDEPVDEESTVDEKIQDSEDTRATEE